MPLKLSLAPISGTPPQGKICRGVSAAAWLVFATVAATGLTGCASEEFLSADRVFSGAELLLQVEDDRPIRAVMLQDLTNGQEYDITSYFIDILPEGQREDPLEVGNFGAQRSDDQYSISLPFAGRLDRSHRYSVSVIDVDGEVMSRAEGEEAFRKHRMKQ